MKPFAPTVELPEFAAEHASNEAERQQLAELFGQFSALAAPDRTSLEQGRARLLAAVNQSDERFVPLFDKLTRLFDLSADDLRALFARAANEAAWVPGPLPWISLLHFQGGPAVAAFDTGLVRFERGMPHPAHRHLGRELVLVLDGAYFDNEEQRWYGPGDIHDMSEGTQHGLQMGADRDVLLAVVMAGGIEIVNV